MEVYKCTKEGEIAKLQSENITLFKYCDDMKNDIKSMNKVYAMIHEQTSSVKVLTNEMVRMNKDVTEIKQDVDDIKKQPVSDFNHYKRVIVGGIITVVISGVLGAFLTLILIQGR